MKTSKFSDSQILAILKQAEAGAPVPELCREHGMSSATFYKWRARFGGMDASMMARLKELESENARLKKMYAEERLKADILKEAIEKSDEAVVPAGAGPKGCAGKIHSGQAGLCGVQYQRNLLPVPSPTGGRKRRNCRLATKVNRNSP